MNNQELKIVEREANKQGLQLEDLFLLKEIDEIENFNQVNDLRGINLNIDLE